jgi:hypothetical protein
VSTESDDPFGPSVASVNRTWEQFRSSLLKFAALPRVRRAQLLFRGQADASWTLRATLDRFRTFTNDVERLFFVNGLLEEFRREAVIVKSAADMLPENDALELLARHHGLRSPLLDWTQSPYIASYFAYNSNDGRAPARVWVLDRAKLTEHRSLPCGCRSNR